MFEQDYVWYQVAHNIKQVYTQYNGNHVPKTVLKRKGKHIINKIKEKLLSNKATISKADKGNSIIVSYQGKYRTKIFDFISDNNFTTVKSELTKTFQRELRKNINEYQLLDTKTKSINT